MAYSGIQMFMEKLNQLINSNDIPFINDPAIVNERPQFQRLYQQLGSVIQTLFIHQHQDLHDLDKVNDLKKRFIGTAEEAEYIVDMFLSGVHTRNTRHFQTNGDFNRSQHHDDVRRSFKCFVDMFLSCVHNRNNGDFFTSGDFSSSLDLDDARRVLKSVEVEFMSMNIDRNKILDSSPIPQTVINQSGATQTSIARNSLGSEKLLDEIIVGIDGDAELIRDKLVEDQKKVDVISIVGMGGIGKTTLAAKVFNDRYVKHHFYVRAWVTVSQTYDKRDALIQILASMGVEIDLEAKNNDSRLRELVHKHLLDKRYLIVIDDIWQIETWDSLRLFFPHDNNGSRILLTSRLTEVAKHANSDGLIHHLGYLEKESSWDLLCQKVFKGNECPKWSIKPGKKIVKNCQGLPLAIVVIAGVLAKDAWSKRLWMEIADGTGSYIAGDQKNKCLETLGLSYNHLPVHLRECFLYLGGFPEDHKFQIQWLIWKWVAEGFIQEDDGRSLEDIAEGYLMDLIDRNLVTVAERRKSCGAVRAFKVHDLVRELCLKKAKEERFLLQTERQVGTSSISNVITPRYKPVRLFIDRDISFLKFLYPSVQNLRSTLCLSDFRSLNKAMANSFLSFELLRVLDLLQCRSDFPKAMELLVHLRYLAIWNTSMTDFPSSICNLWNLQTLIYITGHKCIDLPVNISDLVNLRHLWSFINLLCLPSFKKPMNLQTISKVQLGDRVDNFQKCFPLVKELTCITYLEKELNFKSLTYLENLKFTGLAVKNITLPTTLKKLTLSWCRLPWSEMSSIQSLPNLQILKLNNSSFEGSCWNTDEHVFPQLKFLRLGWLDIQVWEAFGRSFPCLRKLEIVKCWNLKEIPVEIGDIPTLELIQIRYCSHSLGESVCKIQQEQTDLGNYDLKVTVLDQEND